jgi:hypothetical protein
MSKAMDRVDRPSRLLVAIAGVSLGFLELGCAGMNGFRSVGTDRPSFLGFRNSAQAPSPTPENDLYAQNMHANDTNRDTNAKSTELASGKREDRAKSTLPLAEVTTATDLNESLPESALTTKPVGDRTIRVTLGRPEPLRSPDQPPAGSDEVASKPSSSRWTADGTKRGDESQHDSSPMRTAGDVKAPTAAKKPAKKAELPDAKAILAQAEAHLSGMNTYQVKISRIERVGGQLQPAEEILLSIQRDPKAVRLEWTDGPSKGREVIYSSKLDPKMLFVHMPSSPIPIPTMRIAVDSPMVMSNSRHAITEAGFDTIIENLQKARRAAVKEHPAQESLAYKGVETGPGIDAPAHHFVRKTLAGETWNVYLDSRTMLPRLVSAEDSRGELMERYVYQGVRENPAELKTAGAFVPDQRWGESKGLLSRLARAAGVPSQPTASQSTTR